MTSMRQVRRRVTGVIVVSDGEPFGAAANGFIATVGQDEVDGGFDGVAVDAEEFVGGGVAAGGVGGHAGSPAGWARSAWSFREWSCASATAPGLVDEGSVGRVHEADDAVIDVAGQVGGEMERCDISR